MFMSKAIWHKVGSHPHWNRHGKLYEPEKNDVTYISFSDDCVTLTQFQHKIDSDFYYSLAHSSFRLTFLGKSALVAEHSQKPHLDSNITMQLRFMLAIMPVDFTSWNVFFPQVDVSLPSIGFCLVWG